jgi:hypothetical protein
MHDRETVLWFGRIVVIAICRHSKLLQASNKSSGYSPHRLLFVREFF